MVSFPGTDTNNLVNNSVHPPLLPRREDAGAVSLCGGGGCHDDKDQRIQA